MQTERFVVTDATGAGAVRRAASQLATTLGFNANEVGKVALAATEVAQNIFVHARAGEL
jgi:anti-sigma regulatory factor (Ser/Thr protein kinase)